jgi:hypothetical protein
MNDPTSPAKLDVRTKMSLGSSIRALSHGERGWITFEQAAVLFSTKSPEYAFGELDDDGKQNLESFAAESSARPAFIPVEGRLYFVRD